MHLYLVRHGEATSKSTDPQRPLTENGRNKIEKVAEHIRALNIKVTSIWHSPKKRAEETAMILAKSTSSLHGPVEKSGILPEDDVEPIKEELDERKDDVMIVGHLPHLSYLGSLLLTGNKSARDISFSTGEILILEKTEEKWKMVKKISPFDIR